jgi:hypothetical protein
VVGFEDTCKIKGAEIELELLDIVVARRPEFVIALATAVVLSVTVTRSLVTTAADVKTARLIVCGVIVAVNPFIIERLAASLVIMG